VALKTINGVNESAERSTAAAQNTRRLQCHRSVVSSGKVRNRTKRAKMVTLATEKVARANKVESPGMLWVTAIQRVHPARLKAKKAKDLFGTLLGFFLTT